LKNKTRFLKESPSESHKRNVLLAAHYKLGKRHRRPSFFEWSLRFANPIAAVASAAFILLVLAPKFSKELSPHETPPVELSLMSIEPSDWEDLETVMELEALEQWEEVDEWPEG
jgi:hypothetical protein